MNDDQCRQKLTWEPAEGGTWRRTARCERPSSHPGPHNGQGYTWGKFGITPPDDAPASGRVQLCPKCQGQGIVSRPPWVPADVTTWSAPTVAPYRCNLCDGQMVIPA